MLQLIQLLPRNGYLDLHLIACNLQIQLKICSSVLLPFCCRVYTTVSWCCIPFFRRKSDISDNTYSLPLSVRRIMSFLPNLIDIAAIYSFITLGTLSFNFNRRMLFQIRCLYFSAAVISCKNDNLL